MSDTDTTYAMTAHAAALRARRPALRGHDRHRSRRRHASAWARSPRRSWAGRTGPRACEKDAAHRRRCASPRRRPAQPGARSAPRRRTGETGRRRGAGSASVLPGGGARGGGGPAAGGTGGTGGSSAAPADRRRPRTSTASRRRARRPRTGRVDRQRHRPRSPATSFKPVDDDRTPTATAMPNAYEARHRHQRRRRERRLERRTRYGISKATEFRIKSGAAAADTNGNNVIDSEDDSDLDGVSNGVEEANGSDPLNHGLRRRRRPGRHGRPQRRRLPGRPARPGGGADGRRGACTVDEPGSRSPRPSRRGGHPRSRTTRPLRRRSRRPPVETPERARPGGGPGAARGARARERGPRATSSPRLPRRLLLRLREDDARGRSSARGSRARGGDGWRPLRLTAPVVEAPAPAPAPVVEAPGAGRAGPRGRGSPRRRPIPRPRRPGNSTNIVTSTSGAGCGARSGKSAGSHSRWLAVSASRWRVQTPSLSPAWWGQQVARRPLGAGVAAHREAVDGLQPRVLVGVVERRRARRAARGRPPRRACRGRTWPSRARRPRRRRRARSGPRAPSRAGAAAERERDRLAHAASGRGAGRAASRGRAARRGDRSRRRSRPGPRGPARRSAIARSAAACSAGNAGRP